MSSTITPGRIHGEAVSPRSTGRVVAVAATCTIAAIAVVAALVMSIVGVVHASSPATPAAHPASHTVTPAHPATPPAHPVVPSATMENLQRELGQLNYYEGPVNGVMTSQTIDAIKYLQRDAKLPQTGELNAQTQTALTAMIAHGNNQMGAN
jgi:hypothetical protein